TRAQRADGRCLSEIRPAWPESGRREIGSRARRVACPNRDDPDQVRAAALGARSIAEEMFVATVPLSVGTTVAVGALSEPAAARGAAGGVNLALGALQVAAAAFHDPACCRAAPGRSRRCRSP